MGNTGPNGLFKNNIFEPIRVFKTSRVLEKLGQTSTAHRVLRILRIRGFFNFLHVKYRKIK